MGQARYTITKIEAQKKKKDRVNIYLDGKYAFPLNLEAVLELGIQKDQTLTEEELNSLVLESELEKVLAKVYNFLSYRPRSRREVEDRLYQYTKDYGDRQALLTGKALSALDKKSMLDDKEFALWYVKQRMSHKPRSSRELTGELLQKGIDKKTINYALEDAGFNETNSLKKLIKKHKDTKSPDQLIRYLLRKGFSYAKIKDLLKS